MTIGANFYSRSLFMAACVVLLGTNILVLTGVAANRSGTPDAQIRLTERELGLHYRTYKENSGLSLDLAWRTLPKDKERAVGHWHSPAWLDSQKLTDLGFDVDRFRNASGERSYSKRPIPKEVYIVLEIAGAPHQEALRRAQDAVEAKRAQLAQGRSDEDEVRALERAEKELLRERGEKSRLFAVDAGLEPASLRARYGDRERFIIAKGLVQPTYSTYKNESEVTGYIKKLSTEKLHVPLKLRPVIDALRAVDRNDADDIRSPRYQVELAYGNRFEPWIIAVAPLDQGEDAFEGSDDDDIIGLLSR